MIILLITTIAQYIYPNVIECEIDDNYFEDAACFNLDQYENHLRLYVPDADCINLSYITHSKEKYAVLYPQKNSFFDLHNVTQDGNSTVVVRILECNS